MVRFMRVYYGMYSSSLMAHLAQYTTVGVVCHWRLSMAFQAQYDILQAYYGTLVGIVCHSRHCGIVGLIWHSRHWRLVYHSKRSMALYTQYNMRVQCGIYSNSFMAHQAQYTTVGVVCHRRLSMAFQAQYDILQAYYGTLVGHSMSQQALWHSWLNMAQQALEVNISQQTQYGIVDIVQHASIMWHIQQQPYGAFTHSILQQAQYVIEGLVWHFRHSMT